MRDDDHRHPLLPAHVLKQFEDCLTGLVIKCTCRLITKEKLRILCKGSRYGNTLLFATGKLCGEIPHSILKSDFSEDLCRIQRILADLHGLVFGKNHQTLYKAIIASQPDAVLVCGDLVVSRDTETLEAAAGLLLRICDQIPVFYALGNHEYKMLLNPETEIFYSNYEKLLTSAGICFLHNEHTSVQLKGNDFVFHGLELPVKYYHKPNSPALSLTAMEEMIGTPSQPGFHVLLAHNPKYGNTYFSWGADLILSGHYHGGVLRLDQNHGLTCPQYLLFPPFCCGEFKKGKQHMIVSAGLGEHTIPVRIHNPRELVLINLYPQSTKSVKEH